MSATVYFFRGTKAGKKCPCSAQVGISVVRKRCHAATFLRASSYRVHVQYSLPDLVSIPMIPCSLRMVLPQTTVRRNRGERQPNDSAGEANGRFGERGEGHLVPVAERVSSLLCAVRHQPFFVGVGPSNTLRRGCVSRRPAVCVAIYQPSSVEYYKQIYSVARSERSKPVKLDCMPLAHYSTTVRACAQSLRA